MRGFNAVFRWAVCGPDQVTPAFPVLQGKERWDRPVSFCPASSAAGCVHVGRTKDASAVFTTTDRVPTGVLQGWWPACANINRLSQKYLSRKLLLKEWVQSVSTHPRADGKSEVSSSARHFCSFTVKHCCSIHLNKWRSLGPCFKK